MNGPTTPIVAPSSLADSASEVEEIASKLTDAQRLAVFALPADGGCADPYTDPPWPGLWMRVELGELGEMHPEAVFNHGFRLTPLGLAVRAHLLASQVPGPISNEREEKSNG